MEASLFPMSSAMLKVARELAGTFLVNGLGPCALYHVGDLCRWPRWRSGSG